MSEQFQLLHSWKLKSDHDLEACRQLLQAGEPLAEIIAFHAQQAVEMRYPESLDWGDRIDVSEYVDLAERSCETIWSHTGRET